MSDDAYEARVRSYVVLPRITHKIVCEGKVIGHLWDNGGMTFDDEQPLIAPQVRACHDG